MRIIIHTFFISLYLLSIGTRFYSSDAQVMYETSRALAFTQSIALSDDYGLPQIRQGAGGRWYSQYDPGLPLMAAPLVWLSDRLAAWQLWHRYAFAAWSVRILSAVGAALAATLVYSLALTVYQNRRVALALALTAGLCTPLWAYGRMFFAEGLLAGLLTLAFWWVWRGKPLAAGGALGLAMLARASMAIYLLPLLVVLIAGYAPPRMSSMGRLLVFPLLAVAGLLYHNVVRAGDPLHFGYAGQAFDTPFWEGAVGLLLSPGKSVFLYAPPLILSLVGWRHFYRQARGLALGLLTAAGVALVFYGSWWAWHGGWSWGPRFLVPLIPLWVLPAGGVFQAAVQDRRWAAGVVACVGSGLAIGFAGAFTDVTHHYARYDVVNYSLGGSPLVGAFDSLLAGNLEMPGVLRLQALGWLPLPAAVFPIVLVASCFLSLVYLYKRSS